MTAVIRAKHYEQSVKDYHNIQANKIRDEYVRLSNENRALKADYNSAMEQLHEVQTRIETVMETLKEVRS
jgi:hypothetical protein